MIAGALARLGVDDQPGTGLIVVNGVATVLLGLVLAAGVVAPDGAGVVAAGVSLLLFVGGCGLFLWSYGVAVQRSRTDLIGIGGLYFLTGTAPPAVRRVFLACLAAQTVFALVAAIARPFTALAFGVLAPMFGLGAQGLWAARHGVFGSRDTG